MRALRRRLDQWMATSQTLVKGALFTVVFICLVSFSILSIFYLYLPPRSTKYQKETYRTEKLKAMSVICMYSVSGQYGRAPKYLYFILTTAVVLLRHQSWLAVGAAASAMTYSGVAAMHAIITFVGNNRLRQPKSHTYCEHFPLDGLFATSLPICAGVYDPDYAKANNIISAGLLAALPMAAWSSTFHKHQAKAVLLIWLLLLAIGHLAYLLTTTNPNRHYQICPSEVSESPLRNNYSAPTITDEDWHATLVNISRGYEVASNTRCIYSCFDSGAYVGRSGQDIGVYSGTAVELDLFAGTRRLGIAFWLLYATFATVTIVARYFRPRRPERYLQDELYSAWTTPKPEKKTRVGTVFSVLKTNKIAVLETSIRFYSAASFIGFILYCEILDRNEVFDEPFAAVGQWGSVAVILMVLVAAVIFKYGQEISPSQPVESPSASDDEFSWRPGVGFAS